MSQDADAVAAAAVVESEAASESQPPPNTSNKVQPLLPDSEQDTDGNNDDRTTDSATDGTKPKKPRSGLHLFLKTAKKVSVMAQSVAAFSEPQRRRLRFITRRGGGSLFRFIRVKRDFFAKEERHLDPKTHLIRTVIVTLFLVLLSAAWAVLSVRDKNWTNFIYSLVFLAITLLFLFLDYYDNFAWFQRKFETSFNNNGQTVFTLSFCVLAFADYILIGLEEDDIVRGEVLDWFINVLYYVSLPLFFCTFLAHWKTFAFYCSEKPFMHALFYLTIVGYILIWLARWLRPVREDDGSSWHRKHPLSVILSAMVQVLLFFFIFFVILGGIGIAAFAQFSRETSDTFGVGVAILAFCVVSMCIMLTPLAPGSIVDACGGFVFVQVLVEEGGWGFFSAWIVGIFAVVALHWAGACCQWWIGTWGCVQIWANIALPVEMLAASDAVLRKANWFKVGLVGYIFMDTANGLNQGRINMGFCTQLFSEWPAFPNALGLVSLGAAIAAQGLELSGTDWTVIAVPFFVMFATFVQALGTSYGARAMGNSVDTVTYWTSREKWTMMQFFAGEGFQPSKDGWNHDVFNLGKITVPEMPTIMFELVAPFHKEYIEKRKVTSDAEKRLQLFADYRQKLILARENHYEHFREHLDHCVSEGWMVHTPIERTMRNFFEPSDEEDKISKWKLRLYTFLVVVLTVTFWISFIGIYWITDLAEAVSEGVDILKEVNFWAWIGFGIFIVDICFIFHREIFSTSVALCTTSKWLCTGCKINPELETKFTTPQFQLKQEWIPHWDKKQDQEVFGDESTQQTDSVVVVAMDEVADSVDSVE